METNSLVQLILTKSESDLQFKMVSFCFKEAAYSHDCLKVETADKIRTCGNHNFQNKYLERFLSNLFIYPEFLNAKWWQHVLLPTLNRSYSKTY